ncbi:MAG: phosphoribosylglycinamide formyltransferase [Flavobacteriales bacterium]|nr:phosphoribosylglycinamide formyltransferase [Flavobacteriales bacterium]
MVRIALFASGSGTNVERLIAHFLAHDQVEVVLVGCDRPEAGVVARAWTAGVPLHLFNARDLEEGRVQRELELWHVDLIVLAGFLRLIPPELVRAFPDRILNIHPSLLPKFGGKGMFGERVHEAVLADQEAVSGITVHLVNERYDEGAIVFQATCPVLKNDTPGSLAARIHALEHEHYPLVVENYAKKLGPRA